jgi:hypothetical protein
VQDAHVKAMLERRRRTGPSPIMISSTDIHSITHIKNEQGDGDSGAGGSGEGNGGVVQDNDLRLTADGDLVPMTPALESGRKYSGGLHARNTTSTTTSTTSTTSAAGTGRRGLDESDSLYRTFMGEVRSGPTSQSQSQAASSAVQWRSVSSAHNRTISSSSGSGLAAPPASAKIDALGERAWHCRKLSTPYQPPQGVVGASAIGPGVGNGGPPSGPSNTPLPPTPTPNQRVRALPVHAGNGQNQGQGNVSRPPLRPRRSFDTMVFKPDHEVTYIPSAGLKIAPGASKASSSSALGMSQANANVSTPSLGRYGSIKKSREPFIESPILGWPKSPGRGGGQRERQEDSLTERPPTIPVLPPIAPCERFDHKRWRDTIYAEN